MTEAQLYYLERGSTPRPVKPPPPKPTWADLFRLAIVAESKKEG